MHATNNSRTIAAFLINLTLYTIILFFYEGTAFAANMLAGDSIYTDSELTTKTFSHNISNQKTPVNFYKTDSIFSFRSIKGYFSSLIHNIGEQAAAPFHFTKKQWIYTGVAAGITTALIFADEDIDEWARVQNQKHQWVNKSSPFISEFGSNYGVYSVRKSIRSLNNMVNENLSYNEKHRETQLKNINS